MKKKIILLILVIISIFSLIKPMEMTEWKDSNEKSDMELVQTNANQDSLPKEIWKEILLILINSSDNLEDLKKSILNFALVNKNCSEVVKSDLLQLKNIFNIRKQEILNSIKDSLENKGCNWFYSINAACRWAAWKNHKDIVKLLIDNGANVNEKNNIGGCTALIIAAGNGHKDIVELLINNGANVNEKSDTGDTALIKASCNGYKEIVKLLLEKDANVNEEDLRGNITLIRAFWNDNEWNNNEEIVKLLGQKIVQDMLNDFQRIQDRERFKENLILP